MLLTICFFPFFTDAYARTLMFFSLSKKKVIVNPVNLPQFDFVEAEKIDDTEKSISVLSISISNLPFDLIICSRDIFCDNYICNYD